MPIVSYTDKDIIVQCCAGCRAMHELPVDSLELGAQGIAPNPFVIMFPPCSCGAVEGVFCNYDADYSGEDRGSLHGRTVIALGELLQHRGQVHPACVEAVVGLPVRGAELVPLEIPPPW